MIELRHGRAHLALHQLQAGDATTPLLLLHELGATASMWRSETLEWRGPVHALDFSGHGESSAIAGGAYTPELLTGDADSALEHLGTAIVVGAGIGAYVAMLLAAGRTEHVPAALLLPGVGLDGGGDTPDFQAPKSAFVGSIGRFREHDCDPMVAFLEHDVRPVDYVTRLAPAARRLLLLEDGSARPPWWHAVAGLANARVLCGDVHQGIRALAIAGAAAGTPDSSA